MHRMEKYVFDEKFEKNILIVRMRKIDCGKTSFVQKIGVNNLFSTLKKAKWVSHIELSTSREAKIQCYLGKQVDFHYPSSIDDLDE